MAHSTIAFTTSNHANHFSRESEIGAGGMSGLGVVAGGAARSSLSGVACCWEASSVYTLTSLGGCYRRVNLIPSNRRIFNLQHCRTYSRRREHQTDDRLGVLDLTARDHLECFGNWQADDFKNLIVVE